MAERSKAKIRHISTLVRNLDALIMAYRVALPAPQGDDTLEWLDVLIERLDDIARGPVYGGTASEVAALLRSQAERIAALEVERDRWYKACENAEIAAEQAKEQREEHARRRVHTEASWYEVSQQRDAAESLLADAREALEPFAGLPEGWHIVAYNKTGTTACAFNAGEVERARATLSRLKLGEKGGE